MRPVLAGRDGGAPRRGHVSALSLPYKGCTSTLSNTVMTLECGPCATAQPGARIAAVEIEV
jgi:hypothetical protein